MIIDSYIRSEVSSLSNKYYNQYIKTISKERYVRESVRSAIQCLVSNLFHTVKGGEDSLVVVLKEEYYSKPIIVNGNTVKRKVSWTHMIGVFNWLVESKGCELFRGGELISVNTYTGEEVRTKSIFRFSEEVIADILPYMGSNWWRVDSVLELRDEDKQPIVFDQTPYTRKTIKTLKKYNNFCNKITVESKDGRCYNSQIRRIYNECFENGGRNYVFNGGVQMIDSETQRTTIKIDGQNTVELDYKSLHPSILYAWNGIEIDDDPYQIHMEGYDDEVLRKIAKTALLIVFNCKGYASALGALRSEIVATRDTDEWIEKNLTPVEIDYAKILKLLREKHQPIKKWFYSGVGRQLQRVDGDIMSYILDKFVDKKVLAIPVHDSIILPEDYESYGYVIMTEAYKEFVGTELNCKVEKK